MTVSLSYAVQARTGKAPSGSGGTPDRTKVLTDGTNGNFVAPAKIETEPRASDIQAKHM